MKTVIRWSPRREAQSLQNMFDRFYADTFRPFAQTSSVNTFALEVYEDAEAYTVSAVLPGLSLENLNLNVEGDILTIEGEIKPAVVEGENTRALLQERVYGKFQRRLRLPNEVDRENAEAHYENGIVTVVLHKVPEAQPRQIPVKVISNK